MHPLTWRPGDLATPVLSLSTAMPHQTEPNVNVAIAGLLQGMLARSSVLAENTQTISGSPGLKPDVLITAHGRSPVVIEAEYMPAASVEQEAKSRLGLEAASNGRIIEAVIALRYPDEIGDAHNLQDALTTAPLSYCIFTEGSKDVDRFPESGWLDGSVEDLADMVRLVSVPQRAVDQAADIMQQGIERVAAILDTIDRTRPAITRAIAERLGMVNVPQTRRMACAIIANAMVFHQRIAGMHDGIMPLHQVCSRDVPNPQRETLAAWDDILKINYWPIFAIGKDILSQLRPEDAADILRTLEHTASDVNATGIDNAHDLTGRIFQRLIVDRKYLATFYTLPASAALLARLAVAKLEGVDWSSPEAIGKLRIGDFACGTGALLSAVYEQIASRHERAGGDPEAMHRVMMEEVLYGFDVMPSAVHITSSTLSGTEPSMGFEKSRLYPLPYGRQKDGSVKIGSLEFLGTSALWTSFNASDEAWRVGSAGQETAQRIIAEILDESFDLVIMNPPFTRATNHEGAHADITNPAFAAFGATDDDQTAMGKRVNQLGDDSCYHGNAGIASAFAALAHNKLKPGGVLALVLPLSATNGLSWKGFREVVASQYTDLSVLTIASEDNDALSFSSDTGMAECLVISRKLRQGELARDRAIFASLEGRLTEFVAANSLANRLLDGKHVRQLDDGPFGGTPMLVGEELVGQSIGVPWQSDGEGWGAVRLSDCSLAQTAYALSKSRLWLPGDPSPMDLKTTSLGDICNLGLVHRDITGPAPRGPFDKAAPTHTATYPALWNHDAKRETRMVCIPDSQLHVRNGMEAKASAIWATASRPHLNLDFRFNSQPLTVAITEQPSVGGRAWPNVQFQVPQYDAAFAIWGNCTLGLLSFWWHSTRGVAGRGTTTITSINSLPVLDLRALSDDQLYTAEIIFEEFRDKELMPAYLADADPNRALLDRRVICDLLGFDEDTYVAVRRLCAKWCAEPSVHGGKARPKDAKLII